MLELVQDAYSASTLQTWVNGVANPHYVMRTSPPTQAQTDYGLDFEGYPTFPLIDLQTMQVVDSDCWYAASWQACIEAHL